MSVYWRGSPTDLRNFLHLLPGCLHLRELHVHPEFIKNGLEPLDALRGIHPVHLSNLEKLWISDCFFGPVVLSVINCPNLLHLVMDDVVWSVPSDTAIFLPNLETLSIRGGMLPNLLVPPPIITSNPSIRVLRFENCSMPPEMFQSIHYNLNGTLSRIEIFECLSSTLFNLPLYSSGH